MKFQIFLSRQTKEMAILVTGTFLEAFVPGGFVQDIAKCTELMSREAEDMGSCPTDGVSCS